MIKSILILLTTMGFTHYSWTQPAPITTVVQFNTGEHEITTTADSTLLILLDSIDMSNVDHFEIVAHTDAIGNIGYNEGLSKRRAEAVRNWFVDRDIESSRCILSWRGERDSIVTNASVQERKLNRRAVITTIMRRVISKVEGSVLDSNGVGIPALIVVRGADFRDSTATDSSGKFSLMAPHDHVLAIDVFPKGYLYETRMFKNDRRKLDLSFKPIPLQRGVRFQMHNFYFVGNQAILLEPSKPELVRLLRFMELNPTTVIAIEGHINNPNNPRDERDSEHFRLSENRAKMVYDYLIDHEINAQRLSQEGFGNWHMVNPKARSLEDQAANRRVEIIIVEQ